MTGPQLDKWIHGYMYIYSLLFTYCLRYTQYEA